MRAMKGDEVREKGLALACRKSGSGRLRCRTLRQLGSC